MDDRSNSASPFARLAKLTTTQADGCGLVLNKARHELHLASTRDVVLAAKGHEFVPRIMAMAQEALRHTQPTTQDDALLEAQTHAVTTFLAGVLVGYVAGDRAIVDAAQLAGLLQSLATAVSFDHRGQESSTD